MSAEEAYEYRETPLLKRVPGKYVYLPLLHKEVRRYDAPWLPRSHSGRIEHLWMEMEASWPDEKRIGCLFHPDEFRPYDPYRDAAWVRPHLSEADKRQAAMVARKAKRRQIANADDPGYGRWA